MITSETTEMRFEAVDDFDRHELVDGDIQPEEHETRRSDQTLLMCSKPRGRF